MVEFAKDVIDGNPGIHAFLFPRYHFSMRVLEYEVCHVQNVGSDVFNEKALISARKFICHF